MLRNYFITAFRNLARKKSSTFVNIGGLTLGIASSLILFLIVKHQSSFDNFHSKRDRIYRVVTQSDGNDGKNYSAGIPSVLPKAFATDFAEAEEVVFITYRADAIILVPQRDNEPKKYSEEKGVAFTDPTFFRVFDRPVLQGQPASSLDEPNEAVISKSLAIKYFGKEDVLGEIVTRENEDYQIKAVMDDYPSNTDFPFDLLLSYTTIEKQNETGGWNSIWSDENCYFLLREGASIDEVNRRMPSFAEKHKGKPGPGNQTFLTQPLSEIHFDERFGNYNYNVTSRQMLAALGVVAIFLLLTAAINFINLATAEAMKRSKEVGVRKALGSSRRQLMSQFLGETTLVTIISVLLALGITQFALTFLNPFLETKLLLDFSNDGALWMFIVAVTILASLLSGLYPATVISAFRPALALKSQGNGKSSTGYLLRRSLVVLQFFISQFFIIGTLVLLNQMNYFQQKDLGFRRDAIVTVPIPEREVGVSDGGSGKMKTLRDQLLQVPGVESASLCNTAPSSGSVSNTRFAMYGREDRFETQIKTADDSYISLFGLTLLAGEGLTDGDTATGFVVNEKLVSMVGFKNPEEIIQKEILLWGKRLPVRGVVKDFHTVSLHDPIEPVILLNRIRNYETISLKLNPANMTATLDAVKKKWDAAYPKAVFSYEFIDQSIEEFYERDSKMSVLLSIFTSLAIFIGCLGLFGLATFMANQKTKEIGVRKVLGASVENIVFIFSKEFISLIAIGFLIAAPVSWYVMNKWLDEFAYKIELGPAIFLTGLAITVTIALLTVGYRSFMAASVNPVDSLRSE